MAKRVQKKLTNNQRAYEKERKRLQAGLRRWERKGFIFQESSIPDRPSRVTQKRLNQIRNLKPADLLRYAQVAGEGGEIISGSQAYQERRKASARKAAETRARNRASARAFYGGKDTGYTYEELPKGGEVIFQNILDDFIMRLTQDPGNYTPFGRPRNKVVVEESNRQRNTLLSITRAAIARDGKEAVGWILQENSDRITGLIEYLLYGSSQEAVATASRELAEIVNGKSLSMRQLMEFSEESEMGEDWEIPE